MGKVSTHDKSIFEISFPFAVLFTSPMPYILPTDTCVVETGKPNFEAPITNAPVIRLAVKPCPWLKRHILLLMVWATFRAFNKPPTAITKASAAIYTGILKSRVMSNSETSFGVSFNPLAKDTMAALA